MISHDRDAEKGDFHDPGAADEEKFKEYTIMRTNVKQLDNDYEIYDLFNGRKLENAWVKFEPIYGDFKFKISYEAID